MALIIYLIAILITSQIGTSLQTYVSSKYYGNPIGNTLECNRFQKLINAKLKARESELLASQFFAMNVLKTLQTSSYQAQWFQVRLFFVFMSLVQKGRSHHLLKKTLSKKKKDAKTENDLKAKELLDLIPNLQDEIAYLRKELDLNEDELQRRTEDSEFLKNLHEQGFVDQDGNPIKE